MESNRMEKATKKNSREGKHKGMKKREREIE